MRYAAVSVSAADAGGNHGAAEEALTACAAAEETLTTCAAAEKMLTVCAAAEEALVGLHSS